MSPARAPAELLGEAELAPGGLAEARATLARYAARDSPQREFQQRMLAFVDAHADALLRSCAPGHLTASALLLDAHGERVLLTLHAKLGRWLQLGGHCDGEGNLALGALREAREESGIAALRIEPQPFDLDIHAIPARPGEPEHLHLDTRFLVWAPAGASERISAESHALRWFLPSELDAIECDDSVRRLVRLAWSRGPG